MNFCERMTWLTGELIGNTNESIQRDLDKSIINKDINKIANLFCLVFEHMLNQSDYYIDDKDFFYNNIDEISKDYYNDYKF